MNRKRLFIYKPYISIFYFTLVYMQIIPRLKYASLFRPCQGSSKALKGRGRIDIRSAPPSEEDAVTSLWYRWGGGGDSTSTPLFFSYLAVAKGTKLVHERFKEKLIERVQRVISEFVGHPLLLPCFRIVPPSVCM